MFNPIQKKIPKQTKDRCKIRIKQSPDGSKSLTFSGECSQQELEMAKESLKSGGQSAKLADE